VLADILVLALRLSLFMSSMISIYSEDSYDDSTFDTCRIKILSFVWNVSVSFSVKLALILSIDRLYFVLAPVKRNTSSLKNHPEIVCSVCFLVALALYLPFFVLVFSNP